MAQSLVIEHINHIARPTKRLEQSRRFYTEVLGAREISRPPFSFRGAWLYLPGMQIHLIENEALAPDPPPEVGTQESHVAFAVPDVDAMEKILQEHGIQYRRNVIPGRNVQQIFFRDPDGHLIEIGKYGVMDA
jgi:glyoxylase I family protein